MVIEAMKLKDASSLEEKTMTNIDNILKRVTEISVSSEEREKALARPELFRLKDVLPKNIPVLRIVSIGDFDIQADGGTHIKNTKEIGNIKITNFKNKGKNNRRVYWKLE